MTVFNSMFSENKYFHNLKNSNFFEEWYDYLSVFGNYCFNIGPIVLTSIFFTGNNLLFQSISIDSLYSAMFFIKHFIDDNLTESQIIDVSSSLYNGSVFDRYIYYSMIYSIYIIMCNLLWVDDINIIYYGLLLTTIPFIINKVLRSILFDKIKERKEYFIKLIVSKQLSSLIKKSAYVYLDREIEIDYREILPILKSYSDTITYLQYVLKNTLIMFLVSYVKKYSTKFYYKMLKYIYNYKTGTTLESYNKESAKKMLTNIIDNKQWYELMKPNIYRAIFLLFQTNDDDTDFIKIIINKFNYKMITMFTIWTITSFADMFFVAPLISTFFHFYKKKNKNLSIRNLHKLFVLMLATLSGYYINSIFLTSFICQFGYSILFNNITISSLRSIKNELVNNLRLINKTNLKYNFPTVLTLLYTISYGYMPELQNTSIIISLVYILLINDDYKKCFILASMVTSGNISNFNITHLIHNSCVIYILLALTTNQDFINFIIKNYRYYYLNYGVYQREFYKKISRFRFRNLKKLINNNNKLEQFEIMDTNRFPSISNFKTPQGVWSKSLSKRETDKQIYINKPDKKAIIINKQKIISIVKPDTESMGSTESKEMDSLIFELSKDKFIDRITTDEEIDKKSIQSNNSNYSNNSNNLSSYSVSGNKSNQSNLTIIDDYY